MITGVFKKAEKRALKWWHSHNIIAAWRYKKDKSHLLVCKESAKSKLPHNVLQQIWLAQLRKNDCLHWSDGCFHFLCYHSHICSSLTWQITAKREARSVCQLMAQQQNRPISNVLICCLDLCLLPACSQSQELNWKLWVSCTAAVANFSNATHCPENFLEELENGSIVSAFLTGARPLLLNLMLVKRSLQTSWCLFKTKG